MTPDKHTNTTLSFLLFTCCCIEGADFHRWKRLPRSSVPCVCCVDCLSSRPFRAVAHSLSGWRNRFPSSPYFLTVMTKYVTFHLLKYFLMCKVRFMQLDVLFCKTALPFRPLWGSFICYVKLCQDFKQYILSLNISTDVCYVQNCIHQWWW